MKKKKKQQTFNNSLWRRYLTTVKSQSVPVSLESLINDVGGMMLMKMKMKRQMKEVLCFLPQVVWLLHPTVELSSQVLLRIPSSFYEILVQRFCSWSCVESSWDFFLQPSSEGIEWELDTLFVEVAMLFVVTNNDDQKSGCRDDQATISFEKRRKKVGGNIKATN